MTMEKREASGWDLLTFVVLPFLYLYTGWVLTRLWSWLIMPGFNVPALTLKFAVGVQMIYALLRYKPDSAKESRSPWKLIGQGLVVDTILLGIGAIFHWWL